MKFLPAVLLLLLPCLPGAAQNILMDYDRTYYLAVRVGFNSAFPLIQEFNIDDKRISDYRIHYKVGYMAAVTFSVNFNRFVIQPSVCWYRSNAEIQFTHPQFNSLDVIANSLEETLLLDSEVNSLEVPVLIGYHIVKEGPYAMSLKFGPKGIYRYRSDYGINSSAVSLQHEGDNIPYSINFVSAVGVSIGRLFLDFSYEFGLHTVHSDFSYTDVLTGDVGTIYLSQRTNKLSFSLGFLF